MLPELEALKVLLLREWDPIGVADIPAAADEYDSYAMQVFTFLAGDADAQYIADYLTWVVTERMGMGGNPKHDRDIAEKAVAIHLSRSRQ
jgi:hypothetical protein